MYRQKVNFKNIALQIKAQFIENNNTNLSCFENMDIFDPAQLSLLQIDVQENASLETLLKNKNLPLLELLSIKHIQPKIRSNFTFFIRYCQKNQDFCFNLIDLGIKCPMHQGANENMKQACYIAADALTCDQDIVADLLILPDKSKPRKNDSGNQSDEFQQIQQNIEQQTEQTASPQQNDLLQDSLSEQQRFNKKYKYLMRILEYIGQKQIKNMDQNCINYMIKSLNCLIRKKAEQFFEFLDKKFQILKRLIQLNNFSSVNQFLIKILSDDEIQSQQCKKIKKIIIEGVYRSLIDGIKQEEFSQRLDFLDQLFQTNKYATQDDRTELQKMSDIFSSKETVQFFYEHLLNANTPTQFFNSIAYLQSIVKRMNVDEQIDPYSYSNQAKQETMLFEIDILFSSFSIIFTKGYQNLINLKYPEQYVIFYQKKKQKLVETKFYEFLVLLTKNSRFNNCTLVKKQQSCHLTGNNLIFSNNKQKINILKQCLKQFVSQSKNGINRICIIALIEKILTMQIYEQVNHLNDTQKNTLNQKHLTEAETKLQSSSIKDQPEIANSSAQKQDKLNSNQEDEIVDGEEKKKKINKIKAGLKLNIKKFSLEPNQPTQKQQQNNQVETIKKDQVTDVLKKRQSNLKKDEVFQILQFFAQTIKTHSELNAPQIKKKQKNNETQVGALINKILMIFCNSIWWSEYNDSIISEQKQKFINQIEKMFPYFSFDSICKNYSVTLATNKHPNASAKEKTNPELIFTTQFFKIYSNKKQLSPEKSKQNNNLELSDSDFKSDEQQIHAVKCSIQDFKKFTGFKLDNKSPVKIQSTEPQIPPKKQNEENNVISNTQKKQQKDKIQTVVKQQVKEVVKQNLIANQQKQQKQIILSLPNKKKNLEQKKVKEEIIKQQKVPLQFYIKHCVILV